MRSANIGQAQKHMQHLLDSKVSGRRSTRVREHAIRANKIAEILFRQFQVGPCQYRLHHILWYLGSSIQPLKPTSQYRHWLTVREILLALGRYGKWADQLKGPWQKPR